MRRLLLTTALGLVPLAVLADDTALVLGVERYEQLDRVNRADDLLEARAGLEALGFVVHERANPRAETARDLAAAFAADAGAADRLVVALSGHFVNDGRRSWLLTAEAEAPDLFTVDQVGLSVDSLLAVLAERPGQSVLLLGTGDPGDLDLPDEARLAAGVGDLDIPQGVTVIRSTPFMAAEVLGENMTEPEANLGLPLAANPSLFISGYHPEGWVLMPGPVEVDVVEDTGPSDADLDAEAALWDEATAADTVDAYRAYIRTYPSGRFVGVAEETIAEILSEPNRNARLAEEALGLNREQRRSVQSDLTVLGYDTRGVDGIFGPGSRRAITNWQQSNGYPQSSYLTQEQINRLNAQAERRRAEIEAQAARERAEAERLDREYWGETGAKGDEPGYRAYLNRYPEGLFADVARQRLDAIEAERQQDAEVADRTAWGRAAAEDTVTAYQGYLAAWPQGVFADEARARIAAATQPAGPSEDEIDTARRQEQALGLTGVRAQLLELRLRDLGYSPGPLDGVIDDRTRAALRGYQDSVGLAATGYVDQGTLVQLMAGTRGR